MNFHCIYMELFLARHHQQAKINQIPNEFGLLRALRRSHVEWRRQAILFMFSLHFRVEPLQLTATLHFVHVIHTCKGLLIYTPKSPWKSV